MNKNQFEAYLIMASTIEGGYATGYQHGLRKHYHGDAFQVPGSLDTWQSLSDERGEGFRDGFNGKAPRGFHANIGNNNALKGELPLDSVIKFRISSQIKAKLVKQAQSEQMKLSEWAIKTMLAACEK